MYRKLLSCVLALAALLAPLSGQIYATPDAPFALPFALVKDIETTGTPGVGRELWVMPLGGAPTPTPIPSERKTYLPMVKR